MRNRGTGTLVGKIVATAVLVAVGIVYVATVMVASGPVTPLSVKFAAPANTLLTPYLSQNWQLFAPDPVSEERGLVARARCADSTTTEFIDVTSHHIQAVQDNRFFPSRISRLVSNGMNNLFQEDPVLARYRDRETGDPDDPLSTVGLTESELQVRLQGEQVLSSLAAHELADECSGAVSEVQLRYMLHTFPRWSERSEWDKNGTINVLESSWFTPHS